MYACMPYVHLSHINLPQVGYVPRFNLQNFIKQIDCQPWTMWSQHKTVFNEYQARPSACPFVSGEIHQHAHVSDAR